jgi:pimeloyl-ACP methyl ester carboxylesterase
MVLSASTATWEELREREGWVAASEGGEHRVIRGAGHWLQLDRPDAVIDAVIGAIRRATDHG